MYPDWSRGAPRSRRYHGQYDTSAGGAIYLVEDEDNIFTLQVRDPERLVYVTQTTLSMDDTARIIDALRLRFPEIQGPARTIFVMLLQNRQDAVKAPAKECDVLLVVGSVNSLNSNRLRELAERMGTPAF